MGYNGWVTMGDKRDSQWECIVTNNMFVYLCACCKTTVLWLHNDRECSMTDESLLSK